MSSDAAYLGTCAECDVERHRSPEQLPPQLPLALLTSALQNVAFPLFYYSTTPIYTGRYVYFIERAVLDVKSRYASTISGPNAGSMMVWVLDDLPTARLGVSCRHMHVAAPKLT